MSWVSVVSALLSIVVAILKVLNTKQMREVGKNEQIRQSLKTILVRSKVAKKIDTDSQSFSDDDIDRILRDDFRD